MSDRCAKIAEFYICDDAGSKTKILEFTVFSTFCAGGTPHEEVKEKYYKTQHMQNVGHINHNAFKPFGIDEWLSKCQ